MIEKIRSTYATLDEWGTALQTPFIPEAASELEVDDREFRPMPLSQVAWMGLGSNRDHLQAIRVQIEVGELFPFAQLSLVRSALIGAAQAVWILAPDESSVRLTRSRCVIAHMYAQHSKYLDRLRGIAPEPHAPTELVAEHVRQRHAEIVAQRTKVGERADLNTTNMIETAAWSAFGSQALVDEVDTIWRLASGATHGFAWTLPGRPGTGQMGPPDADGIAAFAAGGAIERFGNGYLAAFTLGRKG